CADLDVDGHIDILSYQGAPYPFSLQGTYLHAYPNDGTGSLVLGPSTQALMDYPVGPNIAVRDANADGIPDLVCISQTGRPPKPALRVFTGHGDGTFATPITLATPSKPLNLAMGDVDGDGHDDIAAAYLTGQNGGKAIAWWHWDGATFVKSPEVLFD